MGSIATYLQAAAARRPDAPLYTYLIDGETAGESWTRGDLDTRARAIGAELLRRGLRGRRVMLLYVPGLDFVAALYGCLYAGAVAVPAYPPDPTRPDRLARTLPRLLAIVNDCGPELVLTSSLILSMTPFLFSHARALEAIPWAASDEWARGDPAAFEPPPIAHEDLAFIQYTSGSTATPKGVVIGHDNLLANLRQLQSVRRGGEHTRFLIWPPFYHDLGLVGGIMLTAYLGAQAFLMSPMDFLRRPARWLQAISRYRTDLSAGPNFALDLCARKLTPADLEGLDLSCWDMVLIGAEPLHLDTLRRFQSLLQPYGLPPNMLVQAYGLAEAVLGCTAGSGDEPYRYLHVNAGALREGLVVADAAGRSIVSCGAPLVDQRVEIVDPATRLRCAPDRVGEIWLAGPNVARGYWRRPEETAATFRGELADAPGVRFLRTGDLGFLHEGEVYVTGRIKDLVIIRGKNHHPQDLERTIEQSHGALRPSCCAAFSVEEDGGERLVVVAEVSAGAVPAGEAGAEALAEITRALRRDLSAQHEIVAHTVVLIEAGTIPKTSSGKIMRHGCRREYLEGRLQALTRSTVSRAAAEGAAVAPPPPPGADAAAMATWLRAVMQQRLGALPEGAGADLPFTELGLDSREAVELTVELERQLGRRLAATLLFDHPSIAALARFLAAAPAPADAAPAPAQAASSRGPASRAQEPIAIIGMGCRFPGGAADPASFWRMLEAGVDAVGEVPADRWDVDQWYAKDWAAPGRTYARWGGFLPDIDRGDGPFFGLRSIELRHLDPQGRLLLEVAWEALEDAGIVPERLKGSDTGVYLGLCGSDYLLRAIADPQAISAHSALGALHSTIAGRLSYWLGLNGPNMPIDTACSSSLVALHLACQALRQGECDLALTGGVNVVLSVEGTIAFSKLRALSPTGRCRTFSSDADGFVRGEGCGVLVLKRLRDAARDGDRVLALIRGSAVNQDGRTNGLSAPSGAAQQAVIRRALKSAGVAPADIDYVECHGTGTALGDPIEVQSLGAVLGEGRARERPVVLGAVKSNIGHTEAAAGVAGVIKTVLAMRNGRIPRNLHFKGPNPHVPWAELPVQVAAEARDWPAAGPRRAGVSSFGISGTNAHVILEDAPPQAAAPADAAGGAGADAQEAGLPFLVSGRTPPALQAQAARLRAHLLAHPALALRDVALSLATTRTHFARRAAVVARTRDELLEALRALSETEGPALLGASAALPPALLGAVEHHLRGEEVPWRSYLPRGRAVPLPTYAFQRERAWLERK